LLFDRLLSAERLLLLMQPRVARRRTRRRRWGGSRLCLFLPVVM
jgi:hypothetical protein